MWMVILQYRKKLLLAATALMLAGGGFLAGRFTVKEPELADGLYRMDEQVEAALADETPMPVLRTTVPGSPVQAAVKSGQTRDAESRQEKTEPEQQPAASGSNREQEGQTGQTGQTEQPGQPGQAGQAGQAGQQNGQPGQAERKGQSGQIGPEGQAAQAEQASQAGLTRQTSQTAGRGADSAQTAQTESGPTAGNSVTKSTGQDQVAPAVPSASGSGVDSPAAKPDPTLIDLNTATLEELMELPRIGESKAKAIIAYREQHGGFRSAYEITEVKGIGEKTYESFKDKITVSR